jgi:hypothetical protein
MKRTIAVIPIFAIGIALVFLATNWAPTLKKSDHSLPAVYAQSGCSNATLNGVYAFSLSGWNTTPPKTAPQGKPNIPAAGVGLATFDGAGNWSTSFTFSKDGDISSVSGAEGNTYSVNSDCTGALAGVADFAIVVRGSGSKLSGVETDAGTASTIEMKKQNTTGCSNATLTGKYALTSTGFGTPPAKGFVPGNSSAPSAFAGVASFDGAGNFTGNFTNSHSGDISSTFVTGTYNVSSDCTGTITSGFDFAIVVLSGGTEAFGVQTDVGTTSSLEVKKL